MMVPVAADITPADELIYVLCQIMRLEAEWQDYRELYLNRVDFDIDKVMALLPEGGYFDKNEFFQFAEKVQVSPSDKQVKLFMDRFGTSDRVETSVMRQLISGGDERVNRKVLLKDGMNPGSYEALGLWLKCLLRCLFSENELKLRLKDRGIPIRNAYEIEFNTPCVDESTLRDRLLARNMTARTRDIRTLLGLISRESGLTFDEAQLETFLKPLDLYTSN